MNFFHHNKPPHSGDEPRTTATQWQLMWWKFKDHRLAHWSLYALLALYFTAAAWEFLAPHDPLQREARLSYSPPQRIHVFHQGRLCRPFVYPQIQHMDSETSARTYTEDTSTPQPIRLFTQGDSYQFWGVLSMSRHLFALAGNAPLRLLGSDRLGRDLLSRVLKGSRVSLSIGFAGVFLSLLLGVFIGGISGYYGGWIDTAIQRFIEILRSFPAIPLWLALSAAMPADWPEMRVYFFMTVILAIIGWTDLARVVRGKFLSLREEDYVLAAKVAGVSEPLIIARHLGPGVLSHLIVTATLAVPNMVLAETSLSFLRLGLRPPAVSWGVLLQDAQNIRAVALYPWLMTPVLFVIATVLLFNFLGDGLRDAADPYRN